MVQNDFQGHRLPGRRHPGFSILAFDLWPATDAGQRRPQGFQAERRSGGLDLSVPHRMRRRGRYRKVGVDMVDALML